MEIQVIAHNVCPPERPLPCSQHQPNCSTTNRSSKIRRTTLRLQVKLERTHRQKRKQIDLKTKQINWLIGKKSHLSIENKLLIYKAVIKPLWSYGIELWGCASESNPVIMQRSQSKILRATTHERINKHHNKLEAHPNPLLEPLL
jgi:hypothetical protein